MFRRRQAKRRQINAKPSGRRVRAALATVGARFRDVAWVLEARVLWRFVDRLRGVADAARWSLERLAWALERWLLWPLQERTAALPVPGRAAGAAALALVALAAVAVGVLSLSGDSGQETEAPVAVAPAAAPVEPSPQEREGPTLEGVPPSFGTGGVAAGTDAGSEVVVDSENAGSDAGTSATSGAEEGTAATSSSEKPVSAGPAAMKVARRFSQAFVLYEIGERPARAMAVFSETATPRLATALAERPPRLPEGTEVPKARVLNLVPGPRRGRAYTVSASLLRVGVTSELRLQMKNQAGNWVVTDVRG
jgi:hypothetical protein